MSMDPRSFSQAFLLSMNCPSGIALAFKTLYLFKPRKKGVIICENQVTPERNINKNLRERVKKILENPAVL